MLTEEKTINSNTAVSGSDASGEKQKKASLSEMKGLFISAEFVAALLMLVCAALCLYVSDRLAEAVATAVGTVVAVACVSVTQRQHRDLLGMGRGEFNRLMYSVYNGKYTENGLRMSIAVRLLPLGLGLVCVVAMLIRAIWGGVGDYGLFPGVMAIFAASAVLGAELPAAMAVTGGITALKQRDIEVSDPEKLGTAARVRSVLADKSVFFASKGTETGGVYINGKAYGVSELSFQEIYPLLAAVYVCDDGALSAAFGFRQQITDGLLRALRTTQFEHGELFVFHTESFRSYDPAVGYASAVCRNGAGERKTYFVGLPEAIIPGVKFELDEFGLRPLGDADMRHIRLHMRRTYSAGREVLAVAERTVGGELVLIGFLHMNCIVSEDARESVDALRSVGVEPVYVSEENESCAFYHARELGIARDMSQVLTGARIDRFKRENLVRAARHARLCAEAEGSHRRALTRLVSSDKVTMSASRSGNDELLRLADVRVASAGGEYSTDFVCRNCSVEDVSLVVRVARSVSAVARRAEYQLFCGAACAMLLCLVTVIAMGTVPFGVGAMVLLSVVLPLPQALVTAKMAVAPARGLMMDFLSGRKTDETPVSAGYGLAIWNALNCLFAAAFSAYIFLSYSSAETIGGEAASAAAFLSVSAYMLANNAVCRVWGKSVLSLKDEEGGIKFLVFTLLALAAVIAVAVTDAASGVFSMAAVPFKNLPLALAPAIAALLAYEIGGAVVRHRRSHDEK